MRRQAKLKHPADRLETCLPGSTIMKTHTVKDLDYTGVEQCGPGFAPDFLFPDWDPAEPSFQRKSIASFRRSCRIPKETPDV